MKALFSSPGKKDEWRDKALWGASRIKNQHTQGYYRGERIHDALTTDVESNGGSLLLHMVEHVWMVASIHHWSMPPNKDLASQTIQRTMSCQQDEDALPIGAESAARDVEKIANVSYDRQKYQHKDVTVDNRRGPMIQYT